MKLIPGKLYKKSNNLLFSVVYYNTPNFNDHIGSINDNDTFVYIKTEHIWHQFIYKDKIVYVYSENKNKEFLTEIK